MFRNLTGQWQNFNCSSNYTKFLWSVEQKDGSFVYHNVKLKEFEVSKGAMQESWDMIKVICSSVDG